MTSEELSKKIRLEAWNMAYRAKTSHMGGNFSMADILASSIQKKNGESDSDSVS